jgi:hypothetical protein
MSTENRSLEQSIAEASDEKKIHARRTGGDDFCDESLDLFNLLRVAVMRELQQKCCKLCILSSPKERGFSPVNLRSSVFICEAQTCR